MVIRANHDLSEDEKYKAQEQSGEKCCTFPDELTKSSCIEWAMEHVQLVSSNGQMMSLLKSMQRRETDQRNRVGSILDYGWQMVYQSDILQVQKMPRF